MVNIYRTYADATIRALQGWYNSKTGLWNGTGWWNSANVLEAVIDYASLIRTASYNGVIATTFAKNKARNFLNKYFDDEGWWALAWIKAYELTRASQYLDMAQTLFNDMTSGWDEVCNGGIWWSKDRKYKNAISNELFLTVAGRLFLHTSLNSYIDWATEEWNWFLNSGMLNAQSLINDGLTNACANNGQTTWTYNQGVILGALVEMYNITSETHFLSQAQSIANVTITTLVNQKGILIEPCEANNSCGEDGPQFKGIFMRNLGYLHSTLVNVSGASSSVGDTYKQFIIRNANSIWQNDRTPANQFGLKWSGPVDKTDPARQTSALDVFNAAMSL